MKMELRWFWAVGLVLLVVLVGYVVSGFKSSGRDLMEPPSPLPPSSRANPSERSPIALRPEQRAEIENALAEGRKIDAIIAMREATGLGLAEAKSAVEAMER